MKKKFNYRTRLDLTILWIQIFFIFDLILESGLITRSTIIILRCCKILLKLHILTSQMTAPSAVSTRHLTS